MGRKYLILFLVLCGAVDALGQENLDTLWTRRIGGAGNDVFYAMARGNDGDVLVCMRYSGDSLNAAGNYVFGIDALGNIVRSVRLPVFSDFDTPKSLSETADGEIEVSSGPYLRRINNAGLITLSLTLPTDYHYDFEGGYGIGYVHEHLYTDNNRYAVGDLYEAKGHGSSVGLVRNGSWNISGNWLAAYNIATGGVRRYCFPCEGFIISPTSYLSWTKTVSQGGTTITASVNNQTEQGWYDEAASYTEQLPSNAGRPDVILGPGDSPWLVTRCDPAHPSLSTSVFVKLGAFPHQTLSDSTAPAPVSFGFYPNGNLLVMGYRSIRPPYSGMRFDIMDGNYGTMLRTAIVQVDSNTVPYGFVLLEDSTIMVIAASSVQTPRDMIVLRTETLSAQGFVPHSSTIELVASEPPTWEYLLRRAPFSQEQIVLDNICTRATAQLAGSGNDHWSMTRTNSRIAFAPLGGLSPDESLDTLRLSAPECLGGLISWTIGNTIGEIEGPYIPDGPYFPQGYVQQFFCRLEQMGVSVRFAITGAPDMDALKVWRKPVGGADSVVVGQLSADPGQHVILDDEATRGRTYVYYLLATDDFGRIWKVPEASDTIFVNGAVFVPTDYSLSAAYPNPFNAVTKFDYALPNQTDVSFRVYDITGRQVATLVDDFQQPGTYSVVFDASLLSTGIYVYSFEAWNYTAHGKVLLLK